MLRKLAKSKSFDLLGVGIVILCAFFSGYLFENLNQVTGWGGISVLVPFGIFSALSSCISVLSDRLTARFNNLGNWLGLIAVVISGCVDYLLGNKGAIFTYPLTFFIQMVAIKVWTNSRKYKASKPLKGRIGGIVIVSTVLISLIFSYWVNGLGFSNHNLLFYLTVLVFAASLMANALNALKLTLQWKFWLFYNFLQLVKSAVQFNFANVGKYIYYIVNSFAGLAFWKHPEPLKA